MTTNSAEHEAKTHISLSGCSSQVSGKFVLVQSACVSITCKNSRINDEELRDWNSTLNTWGTEFLELLTKSHPSSLYCAAPSAVPRLASKNIYITLHDLCPVVCETLSLLPWLPQIKSVQNYTTNFWVSLSESACVSSIPKNAKEASPQSASLHLKLQLDKLAVTAKQILTVQTQFDDKYSKSSM